MSEVPLYGRPLGIAAASGSTEVVQLLLDARADVDGVPSLMSLWGARCRLVGG